MDNPDNASEFIGEFLQHDYDPVKAHEYYMRVRKLKGRAGVQKDAKAKAYETHVVGDAQKRLNTDLKTSPKIKATRRISKAEQRLIRARALVMRIKDPQVKADMMARLVAAERKLKAIEKKHGITPKKKHTSRVPHPKKRNAPLVNRGLAPPGVANRAPS